MTNPMPDATPAPTTEPIRMFPVIPDKKSKGPHPLTIPWSVAELAYSDYAARYGRGQSLERLAERGGFYASEMDDYLPDWRERVGELADLRQRLAAAEGALATATAERDRLRAQLNYRQEPTYPNWGDVKIANMKIETPEQIADAAKRLIEQGECCGGCGSPYGKHTGYAAQFDEIAVGYAYLEATDRATRAEAELSAARQTIERVREWSLKAFTENLSQEWSDDKRYLMLPWETANQLTMMLPSAAELTAVLGDGEQQEQSKGNT